MESTPPYMPNGNKCYKKVDKRRERMFSKIIPPRSDIYEQKLKGIEGMSRG